MDRDLIINKVLRDMKMSGIISEECSGEARMHLNLLYQAAYEDRGRELSAHKTEKIEKVSLDGKVIHTYDSIHEAANKNGYTRDFVSETLRGKRRISPKKLYYFRYAS